MSTRIKGIALKLTIGTPGTDFYADCTAVTITNDEAESDVVTFEDAAGAGSRTYFLNITAIQSTDAASLWSYIWDHAGETVAFKYAPHGNATESASQPYFTGTAKIGPKPTIGGEAGAGSTYTFESVWEIVGIPTLDRTP